MTFRASVTAIEPQIIGTPHTVEYVGNGETPEAAFQDLQGMLSHKKVKPVGKPRIREVKG